MTRLKNTNLGLFKKHWKFQTLDEIFYCGMTQEHIFESFYTMSANKGHFKKEKHGTESV